MKEENFVNRKTIKRIAMYMILLIPICVSMLFLMKFLTNISVGADNPKVSIEGNLEKYINFKISDEDKGTLVQYEVKSGIEQGNDQYRPVKESELTISLNSIDGNYPYAVKVIGKSTEMTNGKTENIQENYQYDGATGTVTIKTSNQDDNGEAINGDKPSQNAKDEYLVIAYYDTYVEQAEERELAIKVALNAALFEENTVITQENEFKGTVSENIGQLSSILYDTFDISNGYIKSNIINGTTYTTTFTETQNIIISKKEAQERIKILENNTFIKENQNENSEEIVEDLGNNGNLVYKSTKIRKENMLELLGEDGVIEIFDINENILATIDKNTQFQEDGTVVITYENEPEDVIIRTSAIQNEGILKIENSKEIKSTMLDVDAKIKTTGKLIGINENVEIVNNEEVKTEIETFTNNYENIIKIKDAQTNVRMELSNSEWTNKQQNEVTFDVYVNSNTVNDNMLKNPTIKIELPSQVEKVILGSSSVVFANGLELQTPYLETNGNGNTVIVANLVGAQTGYDENTLGLVTDVKISATVILKKDIENTVGYVNLTFTNQYTLNGETEVQTKNNEIQITSYKEENIQMEGESISLYTSATTVEATGEELKGLKLEVVPVRGDTTLSDGDTVYEGEFIKYNIKVTNTTDKKIDNIKVLGTIPEGTIYGELEADYYSVWGKYEYNYDETIKEKNIEIGSLEAGKSINKFYEVKVNDLEGEEFEKILKSSIKTYVGEIETANYEISNVAKSAEVQVFLYANLNGIEENGWNYFVKIISEKERTAELSVQLPEMFDIEDITTVNGEEGISDINISEDNIVTATVELISEDSEKENLIQISGTMNNSKIENKTENSEIQLISVASVVVSDIKYVSNENRIVYGYDNISIVMTSDNEGENVKYEDEINYEITVKNIGESNLKGYTTNIEIYDYLPENVDPVSLTYENWSEELELVDEENEVYESTGIFNKEEFEEDISVKRYDDNGDQLPEIDLSLTIPYGESIVIKVKTTAGIVYEKTKVENSVTVSGDDIDAKTSNIITHTILPYDYVEGEDIENPNVPSNPDDTEEPENPDDTDNPSDSGEKYSISGEAWIDENEDGKRQTTEKSLEDITVMLVDTINSSVIQAKQVTDSNGKYSFSDLDNGKYIVVFNYDTDTYSVTEYQKDGVATTMNSDATAKEINLLGTQTKVGLTDIISLDASIQNIDIGLIKNKICDLKLDKYISKVIVKTTSGTKQQTYDNTQLAKVEIKSKEIQGATVVIEYKLVITNEGELPTSVNKVIDYLPGGLEFSSDLNKNWNISKSGEITNTSISNQKIEPGKSVELALVLTKTMTSDSTGTFTNIAEIGEINNSLGTKDIDSIPGNKIQNEDDYSKAELIISVSTGGIILYVTFSIILLVIIGITIKFGILKVQNISLFITILVLVASIYGNNVIAANESNYLPNSLEFRNPDYGSNFIEKNGTYTNAVCGLQNGSVTVNKYTTYTKIFEKVTSDSKISSTKKVTGQLSISKGTSEITKTVEGTDYIFGPFKIKSSNATKYEYSVLTTKGKTIKISEPYNKTNSSNGGFEFYLKVPIESLDEGESICFVNLKATKTDVKTTYNHNLTIQGHYKPTTEHSDGIWGSTETKGDYKGYKNISGWLVDYDNSKQKFYQSVIVTITKKVEIAEPPGTDSKTITWQYEEKEGDLEIIKQDADNSDIKLEGVKIRVECEEEKYNQVFTTDENGKVEIKELKSGVYKITEISNPYYGYNVLAEGSVSVIPGIKNTYILENEKYTGNLQIIKKDLDSDKSLEGVSFRIKKIAWLDINKDGAINNLDVTAIDKYIVLGENKYGIEPYGPGDINDDGLINEEDKTLLQEYLAKLITSVDLGEGYVKATDIEGNKVVGAIRLNNMEIEENPDEATIFTTDENGKIEIINMLTGDYILEEIDVGNNFGYEIDNEYITWNNGSTEGSGTTIPITIKRQSSVETDKVATDTSVKYSNTVNVYNRQKYINLKGYAWEDIVDIDKQTTRNYLYDEKATDKRLKNVAVTLVDEDGNGIEGTMTDANGEYVFEKVEIESIDNGGYIKFAYNGFSYQTVDLNCINEKGEKVKNGNTAKEYEEKNNGTIVDSRTEFNSKFATIKNNKAYREDGNYLGGLSYISDDYTSTLNLVTSESKYGYEGQKYPIRTSNNPDMYFIIARTETNLTEGSSYRIFGQNKTIKQLLKEGVDEIKNINLGLYEREQPDIALLKDLYNVKISVNGYNHIYEYGQRLNHLENNSNDEEAVFNAGVQFPSGKQNDYNNISYNRAIYTSDYDYETPNDSGELEIYATYKLVIKNESTNLKVSVNEIVDYYHEAFTFKSIGTGIDEETGEITGEITDNDYTNDATNKKLYIYINTDAKISGTKEGNNKTEIYVQFSITKEKLGKFLNEATGDDNQKYQSTYNLENIAEITSYSVFDKDGSIYAGIDKDSNPGNADLSKVREGKREDDTSIAPGFMIEVKNSRKITGTVFLDNSVLAADKTRNGDGIYQEGTESTISGVKVGLYKVSDLTKKENVDQYGNKYTTYELKENVIPVGKTTYSEETQEITNSEETQEITNSEETQEITNNDGQFTIQDFYPGEYIIVYTWGNQTYIGDTTNHINVNDYKGTIYKESGRSNSNTWYGHKQDTRYSDAMDNYATRIEIDKENSIITTMDSTTPPMGFGIETGDSLTKKIGNTSGIEKIEFTIPNVDFGITERARQEIDVEKRVKAVEITLANGQTIASFKYNDKGKIEKSKGITYMSPSTVQKNGMIKAEIDSELIQGATVKIQYAISVTNNSELDYDTREYYLYGAPGLKDEIIKYVPSGVYDYLDSTLTLAEAEATSWETKTIEEYNESVEKPTITEDYLRRYNSISTDSEGNTIEYTGYESFTQQYNVEEWKTTIEEARKKRLADKTILYNGDIESKIKEATPGTSVELATLTVSKVLANTDSINLNNDVEITNARREGKTGRKITPSLVYDRAESVVITSPTGENKNYILITGIAISFLVTIATGIIFIKKKVLR